MTRNRLGRIATTGLAGLLLLVPVTEAFAATSAYGEVTPRFMCFGPYFPNFIVDASKISLAQDGDVGDEVFVATKVTLYRLSSAGWQGDQATTWMGTYVNDVGITPYRWWDLTSSGWVSNSNMGQVPFDIENGVTYAAVQDTWFYQGGWVGGISATATDLPGSSISCAV